MYDVFTYLLFPTVFAFCRYVTATSTQKNNGGAFGSIFLLVAVEKRQKKTACRSQEEVLTVSSPAYGLYDERRRCLHGCHIHGTQIQHWSAWEDNQIGHGLYICH